MVEFFITMPLPGLETRMYMCSEKKYVGYNTFDAIRRNVIFTNSGGFNGCVVMQ